MEEDWNELYQQHGIALQDDRAKLLFRKGYKAAQSKGGYSEADLRKAFQEGVLLPNSQISKMDEVFGQVIQSLNQPKEIEIEMDYDPIYGKRGAWTFGDYELTTKVPVTYQKDGKTFLKVKQ